MRYRPTNFNFHSSYKSPNVTIWSIPETIRDLLILPSNQTPTETSRLSASEVCSKARALRHKQGREPFPASTAPDQTRSPEKLDIRTRNGRSSSTREQQFLIPLNTRTTVKMFKKDITPSTKSKVKSSVQRGLRQNFLDSYPGFEPYIEEFMPKKAQLDSTKLPEKSTLYSVDNKPLFYQPQDGPPIPHLKLVHAYPTALPTVQIDRGAIRFVLSGAALMAPGLTSPGGRLPDADKQVEQGGVVAVMAEGKEHACLVGTLKVGTEEIKSKGKGVVLDEGHYLGDGLWKMPLD